MPVNGWLSGADQRPIKDELLKNESHCCSGDIHPAEAECFGTHQVMQRVLRYCASGSSNLCPELFCRRQMELMRPL